jgi:hypothetical protein
MWSQSGAQRRVLDVQSLDSTLMRQRGSNRCAVARDRGARQPANLLQIDRERGDFVLDPRMCSVREQCGLGVEIAFQQPHCGVETVVIEPVRRSAPSQSGPRQFGQAADASLLQDPRESTRRAEVLPHGIGRVALLQEPSPELIEDGPKMGKDV